MPPGSFAVVLQVDGELDLLALAHRLTLAGIDYRLITEVDPPYENVVTALGISPLHTREELRPILGKLKLYKGTA